MFFLELDDPSVIVILFFNARSMKFLNFWAFKVFRVV